MPNPFIHHQAHINGQWQSALSGSQIAVINPATGETLGHVPNMGAAETEHAIAAAQAALPAWRDKSANERSKILRKWFDLIVANREDLAHLLSLELGKPIAEARGEIDYGASYIEWFAEEAKRVYGDTIPALNPNQRIVVIKQPIGVCAAITPWNFPNAMITRKVAPALAAGCTFVLRPASQTPFSALALADLAQQAGLPNGVFNIITGNAQAIGKVLTTHPDVRKFSFTGSTEVGRELMAQCASTIKKVSLELGGNAPFIVFDDADIQAAVLGAMVAKFRNAGQTCVCANRIYVQRGIYDEFVQQFVAATQNLRVGKPLDEQTQMACLVNENAVQHANDLLADALAKGGSLKTGGTHQGTFYQPTVIAHAHDEMRLTTEEIFAPIAPIFIFDDEDEVIQRANAVDVGLAAYLYSRDLARTVRVSERLEYGMVGVNTGLISNAAAPFGGVKQSGLGREGSFYGMDDYLEVKYLAIGEMG
ncbi:NAD-dependent succinate-semialdehyde dehydrogenase [Alysiella filiformis]|uniref:Succinate semialdehyde dehydrogenase n=1 Tax=Alysiella filiformis DSM 16848 TaxID=1120981 RepID=A0A286E518_9NEIS|nr:NAD-dependent succinate-semialdehyde dehydrogenase [Alysiella filiformis]QMT32482.1 NAD-dependent succinate-semialdehyde dehydrogenase [Alysiella filiformis]UBQ57298.1 NAD-dependent succinate-semialdehyde dehydrogenase [Alysiella filiformis DSM 16848]SOD66018.1 succinate semialdehyde dehydrogenase [Alysiella filiformis DSM 16848]